MNQGPSGSRQPSGAFPNPDTVDVSAVSELPPQEPSEIIGQILSAAASQGMGKKQLPPIHVLPPFYQALYAQIKSLMEAEPDAIANCANAAASIFWQYMKQFGEAKLNWVGFYFLKPPAKKSTYRRELVLGPFAGQPACIRIAPGRGVCGTAIKESRTMVVPDVHQFPGHISCDPRSKAEVVVPIFARKRKHGIPELIGVLDADSPTRNGLDDQDAAFLELIGQLIGDTVVFPAAW